MLLSMSILADCLAKYRPLRDITDDKPIIKSMRFLSDEELQLSDEYLYFGHARDFISDVKYEDSYIVVSGKSRLMFNEGDYEMLMNDILSSFEFFATWENRLLDAVEKGATLQEVLDIASEVIHETMYISDLDGNLLASSIGESFEHHPRWAYINEHHRLPGDALGSKLRGLDGSLVADYTRIPQSYLIEDLGAQDTFPLICSYITNGQDDLAVFSIGLGPLSNPASLLHIAQVLVGYCAKAVECSDLRLSVSRTTILGKLIDGESIDMHEMSCFLEKEKLTPPYRLFALTHETRTDQSFRRVFCRRINAMHGSVFAFEYQALILVLAGFQKVDEMLAHLKKYFELHQLRVGISMPFSDMGKLSMGFRQAKFALEGTTQKHNISNCSDSALDYLITSLKKLETVNDFLHPALGILEQYDQENDTDLLYTMQTYLRNERKRQQTSDELNLHRNGLKYRLERIKELTGVDPDDDSERKHLCLSFWLLD